MSYSPVLDESGKPAGVIAIVVETTERVLADRRNALEHQRLQQLFEQAPAFMAMLSGPDHIFEMLNPECGKLIGDRDVIGKPIEAALPEIADQGFVALLDKAFETSQPVTRIADRVFLQRAEDQPTEERFLDFVFQPIRVDGGQVSHIFVQGSDVTERVRGENHQKLLVAELNHRVKNTLASVQSIVSQTLRAAPSPEEARATISGRVMALSRAHDVLTHQRWDGADLDTIIKALIKPFDEQGKGRLKISGPKIRLSTRAALSISSAIHELATNAARHGALSNDAGTVAISWTVKRLKDASLFDLTWIEEGGPAVVEPSRTGFGSKVILRALPIELGGNADIEYASLGLIFKLRTPLANIEESTDIE